MKFTKLKDTDLMLSNVCLGTANFGDKLTRDESFEILDHFVRMGGNFLDTANVYCRWVPGLGNCGEQIIGDWLKSRGGYKDVVVATKGAHYRQDGVKRIDRVTEADIRWDLEDSLRTLGLETIDFYWLHRDDLKKPIEEIMDILLKLRDEGKIRYFGLSNYCAERLEQARDYLKRKGECGPYGVSNQWSLAMVNQGANLNPDPTLVLMSEKEYEWHQKTEVPAMPYSSTAFGFFEKVKQGNVPDHIRNTYWNEENLKTYKKLVAVQQETGYSLQALSVAWFFGMPFPVYPIGSVRNIMQLDGLLEACNVPEGIFR